MIRHAREYRIAGFNNRADLPRSQSFGVRARLCAHTYSRPRVSFAKKITSLTQLTGMDTRRDQTDHSHAASREVFEGTDFYPYPGTGQRMGGTSWEYGEKPRRTTSIIVPHHKAVLRQFSRTAPPDSNQNRIVGPNATRRLLCAPLSKKISSPISSRRPIGPQKASAPPPG
jgi:hypothetical protein